MAGIPLTNARTLATRAAIPVLETDPASPKRQSSFATSAVDIGLSAPHEARDLLIPRALTSFAGLDAQELLSGIRLLQYEMAMPAGRNRWGSPAERLQRFESQSLGLWAAMAERIDALGGVADVSPSSYGPPSQSRMLMHLRGLALSDTFGRKPAEVQGEPPATAPAGHHIIVTGPIPVPSGERATIDQLKRYEPLLQPLPIAPLPALERIDALEAQLLGEFPWAEGAIRQILGDLRSRRLFGSTELGLSPTLLVGPPGSGKSRLVRRLAEELHLPFHAIACGGLTDAKALLGTARGWSSAQASPVLTLLLTRLSASALVLFDEIDKTSEDSANGSLRDAALGLLEPENARAWIDPFLQAPCDLTKLVFMATANRLGPLPSPLLSRLRILHVPAPSGVHAKAIVIGATHDIAREWGLPAEALPVLSIDLDPAREISARAIKAMVRSELGAWALARRQPHQLH
jgi:hypothetical protein